MKSMNKNYKYSFIFNFLILLNYFFWIINIELIRKFIIFFIFVIIIAYLTLDSIKKNFPEKLFIVTALFVGLSSVDNDWDGRYIWLFHAKRILIDNSIYSQLDNYLPFTHNDYPNLIPALSASLGNFFGYINYSALKLSNVIILLGPIIFICSFINSDLKKIVFLTLFLWITQKTFLSGSVDDALAAYSLASSIIIFLFFLNEEEKNFSIIQFLSFLYLISLTLIKNEGLVILLCLIIVGILMKIILIKKKIKIKNLLILALLFIPIFQWKWMCINSNIYSEIATLENFNYLKNRFFDLRSYWNIFNFTVLNVSIILPLILFFIFIPKKINLKIFNNLKILSIKNNYDNAKLFFFVSTCLLYYCALFIIYLSTPYDLYWHLTTSAYRTMMPIGLIIAFYSIFDPEKKNYLFKRS